MKLYHGTSLENAKSIMKTGLKTTMYNGKFYSVPMTNSLKEAKRYALSHPYKQIKNPVVIAVEISKSLILGKMQTKKEIIHYYTAFIPASMIIKMIKLNLQGGNKK